MKSLKQKKTSKNVVQNNHMPKCRKGVRPPSMFVPRGGEPVHTNHRIHLFVDVILIQKLKSSTTDKERVSNTQ